MNLTKFGSPHLDIPSDKDKSSIHTTMLGDRGRGDQWGCPNREGGLKFIRFESPRWRPKLSSRPSWVPGPVCHKTGHTGTSRLRFRQSTYGWKANSIRKSMQVVWCQNTFGINGNHRNKSVSRIWQGATTPSFGPLDRVSCLGLLGGASKGWRPRL